MKLNQIEIQGIVILEPVGSLTDLITGFTGLIVAYLLWKKKASSKSMNIFYKYFLFLGLTTLFAGILGHAFLYYISPLWKLVGWCLSAIGLFFFERASLEFFKPELSSQTYKNLKAITVLKLIAFYLFMINPETRGFHLVQMNAAFCYVGLMLPLYTLASIKWKVKESWHVVIGVLFACFIGFLYNAEVIISQWFNHQALTHALMTIFIIYMYYAVVQLHYGREKNAIAEYEVVQG